MSAAHVSTFSRLVLVTLALILAGCAHAPRAQTRPTAPVILVSMDAFRWDYERLYPAETETLRRLRREGAGARALVPVFPSNTFTNHYSIVTGLYPARHGIINNLFFDRELGEMFYYNRAAAVRDSRWWWGEPVWVTAIRQGRPAATSVWVGSEAAIGGVRPTYWKTYDAVMTMTFAQRLEEIVGWLKLPADQRPALVTLYLEETNSIGHRYGPDSPEIAATIREMDERLTALTQRLAREGIAANLVIVSDHGITPISLERIVVLDDYVKPADVLLDFDGPVAGLRAANGDVAALERAFAGLKNARAYRTENLPAHFRMSANARTPDLWIVPDEGWEIYFRSRLEAFRTRFNRADHGYDPALPSMHGIFIGHGPDFRRGVELPATENVHIYNLLCALLGIEPANNDGDARLVKGALRAPPRE